MMTAEYQPAYLALHESGELERRAQALEKLLLSCTVCPLDCGNNRMEDEIARCYSGRLPVVSSYTAHFGEEPALVGQHGAGNIFFGNCNRTNNFCYCNNLQGKTLMLDGYGFNICDTFSEKELMDCHERLHRKVEQR